ncbi:MAG: guanylate kinase [Planctomycetia bacterium]|nr:guanylate kinase [Planctomycetia bacterium]
MASQPGQLVIVSGPSGAGKTTLLHRVFEQCRLPLAKSISATTRSRRPGERDGKDYHFLSREEFDRRRQRGEFLEACEVFGQGDWYGTLASEVTPSLEAGKWVVLEIDVQGTMEVLRHYPQALTIFVEPGSLAELERRLRDRGTEDPQALERRLAVARREFASADRYRHRVINDEVARAAGEICDILTGASSRHTGEHSE